MHECETSLPSQHSMGDSWQHDEVKMAVYRAVCLAKVVADCEVNRPWYVDNVDNVDNVNNVNNVEHMGLRMDMNSTVCKKLRKHNPKIEMCLKVNAFCW